MMPKRPNSLHQAQAYMYLQILVINSLNFLLILLSLVLLRTLQIHRSTHYWKLRSSLKLRSIFEPIVPTPIHESPSTATAITLPPPSVSTTPSIPQQTATPIPTLAITIDAPMVTTTVLKSNALIIVELRVLKLEKDVSGLKIVDHSTKALAILKSQVPSVVDNYLGSKVRDVFQKELKKYTANLIQKYSLQNPANHRLYHALMEALIEDENTMDKGVVDTVKDHKRKHDDDEDPLAGPNQVEEPIAEVVMDDDGDDVAREDNQLQDTLEPKTRKTLNPDWFKQPPRPLTLDPEWNKHQVILDQPTQHWFNQMVSVTKDPLTFNDLMATPIDFSKYTLKGLKIENLTQDILDPSSIY
nr:hypothetical protein [Tanacetum cinerariifolium]